MKSGHTHQHATGAIDRGVMKKLLSQAVHPCQIPTLKQIRSGSDPIHGHRLPLRWVQAREPERVRHKHVVHIRPDPHRRRRAVADQALRDGIDEHAVPLDRALNRRKADEVHVPAVVDVLQNIAVWATQASKQAESR